MKTARKLIFDRLPTTFDSLIKLHPPRPIHDDVGYKKTVEIVDALAGHPLNRDQDDYLLLLSGASHGHDRRRRFQPERAARSS